MQKVKTLELPKPKKRNPFDKQGFIQNALKVQKILKKEQEWLEQDKREHPDYYAKQLF